ncbi:hypothetical protein [Natrialba asiatica]|uniref:Uncharacterized protein n=1 Tax=Natrialba asiatica (strain ATCC 700177 / DSM 12278 / JCM 9576 / FERM P-10747 / NBRC 102637 / 172P1) TaxID=29540 RepID=M0AHC4_NATA1|nr:hypothetical protein [Natrialba asiatica]ELY98075.1 hypothetical protein C481_19105 [Natrialba asiatica DSM 12278]
MLALGASIGSGAVLGLATPLPFPAAIIGPGLVAIAFIGRALFINGPVSEVADLGEEIELEDVPRFLAPVESVEYRVQRDGADSAGR